MNDIITHYDKLIEEGNDPVHDSKQLQEYMNKWDGIKFINELKLTADKNVLEIGIGTGRIAIKTAPLCAALTGLDISPKTIEKAKENLKHYKNISLHCADFMEFNFNCKFDVIYSSLTFMHIKNKQAAVDKIKALLKKNGRVVLSIDKSQSKYIDMSNRKIKIYPDQKEIIFNCFEAAGLKPEKESETEFAYIISAVIK